ncbi:MAG: GGDEF domain-containing protein [Rhizobiaceae bacterium]|nr:GGDEF domain-containing protein [Rhizobiaceae bacterium]
MRRGWRRIILLTIAGTAACIALSLALNYLLLFSDTLSPFGRSMITATALPLLIGVPAFAYLGLKLEEARGYKRTLTRLASHDGLTDCFNVSAFGALIDRRAAPPQPVGERRGAFLVIEVGNLRQINMRFGLAWGDEAVKLVAETIRASIRSGDIIGRIGSNEFAVFLPGATRENAVDVGERVRADVATAYFTPASVSARLDVRVGGIVFEQDLGFDDMFRAAEETLVEATPADQIRLSVINGNGQRAVH